MSLVAYTFSGSEDENSEDDIQHDLKENNIEGTNIVSSNLPIQLTLDEIPPKEAEDDVQNKSLNVSPKNHTDFNIESDDSVNFPLSEVASNLCLKSKSFSTLPPPKTKTNQFFEESDLEDEVIKNKSFLNLPPVKKKDGRVKIALPALPDLDSDEEEPTKKKIKYVSKSSGLFAFLPEPINMITKEKNRPLIPHTLSKKIPAPIVPPKPQTIDPSSGIQCLTAYDGADVEDDEEETLSADFFSLSSSPTKTNLPPNRILINPISIQLEDNSKLNSPNSDIMDAPLQFNKKLASNITDDYFEAQTPYNYSKEYNQKYNVDNVLLDNYNDPNQVHSDAEFQSNIVDYSQDKEFKKMQGKKHCGKEEITLIDVNADDQLSDSQLFLTKSLSEEKEYRSSRKKGGMPTMQQRRKHQITYLAFQAKERELELKNQWSQNRLTKKQTQAKYGF